MRACRVRVGFSFEAECASAESASARALAPAALGRPDRQYHHHLVQKGRAVATDVQTSVSSPYPTPPGPRPHQRVSLGGKRTLRKDRWWLSPLLNALLLVGFVAYGTWRAFEGQFYFHEPYLAPFYSPCLSQQCVDSGASGWALFPWSAISPALYILVFPGAFRATCYYYRKNYYRSLWASPSACAVNEPHKKYTGETQFPLILNNIHRWTWYPAVLLSALLGWEALRSFWHEGSFHLGLGSIILVINAILIALYTFGCHSCRHITAGRINSFSQHPLRYKMWTGISRLNANHGKWAIVSMIFIVVADYYIRLVAAGTIHGSWV